MTIALLTEDPVALAVCVLDGDVDAFDALWDSCAGNAGTFSHVLVAAQTRRRERQEVGVRVASPGATIAPRRPLPSAGGPSRSALFERGLRRDPPPGVVRILDRALVAASVFAIGMWCVLVLQIARGGWR